MAEETGAKPRGDAQKRLERFIKAFEGASGMTEALVAAITHGEDGLVAALDDLIGEIRGLREDVSGLREDLRAAARAGGLAGLFSALRGR